MTFCEKLTLDKKPHTKRPVRPCSITVSAGLRESVLFKGCSSGAFVHTVQIMTPSATASRVLGACSARVTQSKQGRENTCKCRRGDAAWARQTSCSMPECASPKVPAISMTSEHRVSITASLPKL
jgi:hypothetical protein